MREVFNWSGYDDRLLRPTVSKPGRLGCKIWDESVIGVRLDQRPVDYWRDPAHDPAQVLYRALRENLGDAVSSGTNGVWSLPRAGILSSVSVLMSLGTVGGAGPTQAHWRPVTTAKNTDHTIDKHVTTVALDARFPAEGSILVPRQHASGRAAAAFAQATCQQMGFTRATLVTNCKALYNAAKAHHLRKLLQEDIAWWAKSSGSKNVSAAELEQLDTHLISQLCPELMHEPTSGSSVGDDKHPFGSFRSNAATRRCNRWLEVKATADNPGSASSDIGMAVWLHNMAFNRDHPANYSFSSRTTDIYVSDLGTKFRLGFEGDNTFALPVAPSCGGHPKEKEDISRCFSDQLNSLWDHPQASRDARTCAWKIIIGCSNERSLPAERSNQAPAEDLSAAAGGGGGGGEGEGEGEADGTWVIGDQRATSSGGGVSTNWNSPKIFTGYSGPYNCNTGADAAREMTAASEAHFRKDPQSVGGGFFEDYVRIKKLCWGQLLDY